MCASGLEKKCNTTEAIKVGKKAGGGSGGQNNGDQESKAKEDELAILNHERLLQLRESRGFDARVKKVSEVFCRRVQFCTTKYNIDVHVFFTGNLMHAKFDECEIHAFQLFPVARCPLVPG